MFSQAKAIYFDICFACMKVWWKFQHQYINLDIAVSRASDYLNCQCEPFGPHEFRARNPQITVCLLLKFSQQDSFAGVVAVNFLEKWTGRISSDDEID